MNLQLLSGYLLTNMTQKKEEELIYCFSLKWKVKEILIVTLISEIINKPS